MGRARLLSRLGVQLSRSSMDPTELLFVSVGCVNDSWRLIRQLAPGEERHSWSGKQQSAPISPQAHDGRGLATAREGLAGLLAGVQAVSEVRAGAEKRVKAAAGGGRAEL